ncbi:hypothetical protein V8F06_013696 [Rhypophila decipiens]
MCFNKSSRILPALFAMGRPLGFALAGTTSGGRQEEHRYWEKKMSRTSNKNVCARPLAFSHSLLFLFLSHPIPHLSPFFVRRATKNNRPCKEAKEKKLESSRKKRKFLCVPEVCLLVNPHETAAQIGERTRPCPSQQFRP